MRKILETLLLDLGYNNLTTAVNGLKAWERVQDGDIDLVLSDYLMPEVNGLELLRLIRKSRKFYNLPFIMVTGVDMRGDFMRCLQAEVDHYIIKPPNMNHLGNLVKLALVARKYPSPYLRCMATGKFFFLNEKYEEALENFELASQERNDLALPYYYMAMTYQQLGDEKSCELNFKKSLIIENQFISSILALAEIYEARGDDENLAHYLKLATEVLPDTFDVHVGLARACSRTGDVKKAKKHLDEAARLAKSNLEQNKEVVEGYLEAGFVDKADEIFGRRVQDDNNEKTIHFLNRLGLRSKKSEQYNKAKHYYLSALKLDPQHKVVNYNLASLLAGQKEIEAAESYLKKVLRLYPDFKEAVELLEAVKKVATSTV